MNNIDEILNRLKDQPQPSIPDPDALTDSIMDRIDEMPEGQKKSARSIKTIWWSIAATIAIILGITFMINSGKDETEKKIIAENTTKSTKPVTAEAVIEDNTPTNISVQPEQSGLPGKSELPGKSGQSGESGKSGQSGNSGNSGKPSGPSATHDPNIHYATLTSEPDSTYKDPALIDDFIAKMAEYLEVAPENTEVCQSADSTTATSVYIFSAAQRQDVFGRLLQLAVWYNDDSPDYRLTYSSQLFVFELTDRYKGVKYRWVGEEINGRILLYGEHSPIGTTNSMDCFTQYHNRLLNTDKPIYEL